MLGNHLTDLRMSKQVVVSSSTGKGLQYPGSGYYGAWSGAVAIDQSQYYPMLDFEVGKQSIKGIFEFGMDDYNMASGEAIHLQIVMNGIVIMHRRIEYTGTGVSPSPSDLSTPFYVVLPAMSNIVFQSKADHSSSMNAYVTLQAEEVTNG